MRSADRTRSRSPRCVTPTSPRRTPHGERGGDQEGVPQAREGPSSRPQRQRSEGEGQVRRAELGLRDPRRRRQARPVRPRRDRRRRQAALPGLRGLHGRRAAAARAISRASASASAPVRGGRRGARRAGGGDDIFSQLFGEAFRGAPARPARRRRAQGRGRRGDARPSPSRTWRARRRSASPSRPAASRRRHPEGGRPTARPSACAGSGRRRTAASPATRS